MKATIIIPLMRSGGPMAFGVSKAIPRAAFCHAREFTDITNTDNFNGKRDLVLIESVINSGKSLVNSITPLRESYPPVRIIVVKGVAQADSVIIKPDEEDASRLTMRSPRC
jgi:uracil phosphoribosyltransferase